MSLYGNFVEGKDITRVRTALGLNQTKFAAIFGKKHRRTSIRWEKNGNKFSTWNGGRDWQTGKDIPSDWDRWLQLVERAAKAKKKPAVTSPAAAPRRSRTVTRRKKKRGSK